MAAVANPRKAVAARLNPVHRKVAGDRQHYEWSWAEAVRRLRRVCWGAVDWLRRKVCSEAEGRPIAWVGWRAR